MLKSFESIVSECQYCRTPRSWKLKQSPFKYNKMRWKKKNHKGETECLELCVIQVSNVPQFFVSLTKAQSREKKMLLVTDLFLICFFFVTCHQGKVKSHPFPWRIECFHGFFFFFNCVQNYSLALQITIKKYLQWNKYPLKLTKKLLLNMPANFLRLR